MSSLAPSRRALLGATVWSTPVVLVGGAAPALAASGTSVVATFSVERTAADQVVESGVVTNLGSSPVVVTVRISAAVTPGGTGAVTNGSLSGDGAWMSTYFNWTDGTGADMSSAYYEGYTTTALAPGDSIATPAVTYYLDAAGTTGVARLSLSVPVPATAGPDSTFPIPAYAGIAALRSAPRTTGDFGAPR